MSESVPELVEKSRALEHVGDIAGAIRLAQQAISLAHNLADSEGEAGATLALAYAHLHLGHYPEARRLCQAVYQQAAPNSALRAEALLQLGICACETNDLNEAEEAFQQVIDLSRQNGFFHFLIRSLHNLSAGIYAPRGQFGLSLAADEEVLELTGRLNMPEYRWGAYVTRSWVFWLTGQRPQAEDTLLALQAVAQPGSVGEGYLHLTRAHLALEAGSPAAAAALFEQLLSSSAVSGVMELNFYARQGMARLCRLQGDAPGAVSWAAEALAIAQRAQYIHLQGIALIERGRAAWVLGNLSAAEADFHGALACMAPLQLNFDLARAALYLALLLEQQASPLAAQAWRDAALRLTQGGFAFLVDQERPLAFPLILRHLANPEPALASASQALLEQLQRLPPPPLKVSTFGGLSLWVGTHRLEKSALRQRRAGELLVLLLGARGGLSFDQVSEALWPEKDPRSALTFFHHTTSALRRCLEPDLPEKFPSRYLSVAEGLVSLRLPPGSTVDFERFETLCGQSRWPEALALHPDAEWLPELLYAPWAALERQCLTLLYQGALLAQAASDLAAGQYRPALASCRRVLGLEPWQEQAVLMGMQACLGLKDRAGALRLYRSLAQVLSDELGAEPLKELQDLYRKIISVNS